MVISYVRRAYSSFAAHVFDIPPRLMAFMFFLILLFLPLAGISSSKMSVLIYANIFAIFAVSWDLLVGRTGQISLGHALLFGIGGYSSALLFKYYGLPTWITIPAAMLFSILVSLLIGFPCLRVKGPYLALVTMAVPLIIQLTFKWGPLYSIFGGDTGIRDLPRFFDLILIREQRISVYYLTLLLLFISSVIIYKIANSKTGIVFISILDDEVASKACGINITKYKLMSFVISGLFASLAGCIHAHVLEGVDPSMFSLTISFFAVIMTFLGGIGTIYGPIVGSYIYSVLDSFVLPELPKLLERFNVDITSAFESAKLLIFTLIVLILVIKWPRGVARFTTDKLKDLEEARDLDERGPRIWKTYKKKKK